MDIAKKEKKKPWKTSTSSGHITNIKQSILETFDIYGYSWCKENNDIIQGAGELSQNDVTWGQANSTDMPPDQKSKQSGGANLSLITMRSSVSSFGWDGSHFTFN
jgi:hypothetical protein